MGGKQTIRMRSKGYDGAMMGSPMGAPLVGYPEPFMQTAIAPPVIPPTTFIPPTTMAPPPLPVGYYEPGIVNTTTAYAPMGTMMPATMGAVMPNNNRWKVTMKSKGNPGMAMGLPDGTIAPYYTGNEQYTYKARQRSGGLFSRGPKSTVTIKERNRGAGGYYGGSVMPTTTVMGPPIVGAPPLGPVYEETVQQYPYGAPYIGG